MKPFLSVIGLNWRVGSLDILFNCLKAQTYQDFELVLVDSLYTRRKAMIEAGVPWGFPVTHVEPLDNPFPVCSFCRCANTGLVYARGQIVVYLADYTWIPPDFLAVHAALHRATPNLGVMSPIRYTVLPRRKKAFRNYGFDELEPYLEDLKRGKLDDCLWSIFRDDLRESPDRLGEDLTMYRVDQRRTAPDGPIGPTFCNAKCESLPLASALAINGWDEQLDGTNAHQDTMFGEMIEKQAGLQWVNAKTVTSQIVNPRSIFPHPRWLRPYLTNLWIWENARSLGYPPINTWSLIQKRKELGIDET